MRIDDLIFENQQLLEPASLSRRADDVAQLISDRDSDEVELGDIIIHFEHSLWRHQKIQRCQKGALASLCSGIGLKDDCGI